MFHRLMNHFQNTAVTLRFAILVLFITSFILVIFLIILVTSVRFNHILTFTSKELMNYASRAVLHELTSVVGPAEKEGKFTASLIQSGVLKDDDKQLVPYTYYMSEKFPVVSGAFWADEHGDFIYSIKEKNSTISTEIFKRSGGKNLHTTVTRDVAGEIIKQQATTVMDFDPRTKEWYSRAKTLLKSIWSDIYTFHIRPTRGITTATPVILNNKFLGIFGINVSLDYLSTFLTHQKISANGFSFIVTLNEILVAYPNRPPFTTIKPPGSLANVHTIAMPVIDKSLDIYKKTHMPEFAFMYGGEKYLATYLPVPELSEYGWLVGVIVPSKDFTSELQKMFILSIGLTLIILLLSILVATIFVSRIVRPIKTLVKETEKIKNFELDEDLPIQSHIKEVIYLRNAIRSMKQGLRSFQKYVPKTLVRQLINSGEVTRVGGVKRQLAIMFTDIENFTTIAEIINPNDLMSQLCEYLEELSTILILEKGTIDKYIGDSIMAFWGAPLPEKSPCIYASYAALECQQKLKELNARWLIEGKPAFITRIGIHTGEAIVGNIGSSERLNYTALGDTINMGSRLEKVNKTYQTRILVSNEVYEEIKDYFVLRLVDCVAVKGKTKSNCLYELLGTDVSEIPFDIIKYREYFEKGFTLYQAREWDHAIEMFEQCRIIYPTDTIAPIFIKRCHQFKMNPPDSDWHGVIKLEV